MQKAFRGKQIINVITFTLKQSIYSSDKHCNQYFLNFKMGKLPL